MKNVEVASAIILKREKVLACRRGYGKFKNWWEFPGGKVEQGESPLEAMIRELGEELDAKIKNPRFFEKVDYDYPDFHLSMHCYLCEFADDRFELRVHEEALWLDASSLFSVQWLKADLNLVEHLKRYLESQTK